MARAWSNVSRRALPAWLSDRVLRQLFSVGCLVWQWGDERASRCTAAFAIALTTIIFSGLLSGQIKSWPSHGPITSKRHFSWRDGALFRYTPGNWLRILLNRYTNTFDHWPTSHILMRSRKWARKNKNIKLSGTQHKLMGAHATQSCLFEFDWHCVLCTAPDAKSFKTKYHKIRTLKRKIS